jgi:hypothetical protein
LDSATEKRLVIRTEFALLFRLNVGALEGWFSTLNEFPDVVPQLRVLEDFHQKVESLVDTMVMVTRDDAYLVKPFACFHVAQAM